MKTFKQFFELVSEGFQGNQAPIHNNNLRDNEHARIEEISPINYLLLMLRSQLEDVERHTGMQEFKQRERELYDNLITLMDKRQYKSAGDLYAGMLDNKYNAGDLVLYYYMNHGPYPQMDMDTRKPGYGNVTNQLFEAGLVRWDPKEEKGRTLKEWRALQNDVAEEILEIKKSYIYRNSNGGKSTAKLVMVLSSPTVFERERIEEENENV